MIIVDNTLHAAIIARYFHQSFLLSWIDGNDCRGASMPLLII